MDGTIRVMTITRSEAEQQVWEASDWRIEQTELDRILSWVREDGTLTVPSSQGVSDEIKRAYEQGYQEGQASAPEPSSPGPVPLPSSVTPGQLCKGPDAALWLYLGTPLDLGTSAPAVGERVPSPRGRTPHRGAAKACTKCKNVKPFPSGFHPAGGGKYKSHCKDCENERKRESRRRKREGKPG